MLLVEINVVTITVNATRLHLKYSTETWIMEEVYASKMKFRKRTVPDFLTVMSTYQFKFH